METGKPIGQIRLMRFWQQLRSQLMTCIPPVMCGVYPWNRTSAQAVGAVFPTFGSMSLRPAVAMSVGFGTQWIPGKALGNGPYSVWLWANESNIGTSNGTLARTKACPSSGLILTRYPLSLWLPATVCGEMQSLGMLSSGLGCIRDN